MIEKHTTLRVARPTDRFDEVLHFYTEGLGMRLLGSFEDHDGFDGVMLGLDGAAYHLEFTREHGHTVGRAPTKDNLLVFYIPDHEAWKSVIDRMTAAVINQSPPIILIGIVTAERMKIRTAIGSSYKMPAGRRRSSLFR